MHITCAPQELYRALKLVRHAVTTHTTLPILSQVLLATEGKRKLRLMAADLDIGITCTIAAWVKKEGRIALPAHRLLDLTEQALPAGRLTLQVISEPASGEGPRVLVGNLATLPGTDDSQFPRVRPSTQPDSVMCLPARQFKQAMERVAFAAAPQGYEATLSNVWIQINRRHASLSACNGARCALLLLPVRARKLRGIKGDLLLVPAQPLLRLARLLPDEGEIQLEAAEQGYLRLRSPAGEYVTRLNGNEQVGDMAFHNHINEHTQRWRVRPFAHYIPERPQALLIVERKALQAALKNASGLTLVSFRQDGDRGALVLTQYRDGSTVITCELPAALWGEVFAPRWVNPRALTCALGRPGASASLVLGFVESSRGTIVLRWMGRDGGVNPAYSYAFAPLDPYSALEHPSIWQAFAPADHDLLAELGKQGARAGEEVVITRLRAAALHLIFAILHFRMTPTAEESQHALQRLKQVRFYSFSHFLDTCGEHFDKLVSELAVAAFAPGGCVLEYKQEELRVALDADQVRRALESKGLVASARNEP